MLKMWFAELLNEPLENARWSYHVPVLLAAGPTPVTGWAITFHAGATWATLSSVSIQKYSKCGMIWLRLLAGMFEFNMFGIPYNGADICGFIGETTEQMCQRWVELGAFYPFSRSHNDKDSPQQDPATWDSVANAASKALMIRYRLLPYLYTLFYDSHTKGSTVVRPLYHEYPKDSVTWTLDKQFLWGPAFMVTPVLEEDRTTVEAYFPDDVWYDYYTVSLIVWCVVLELILNW